MTCLILGGFSKITSLWFTQLCKLVHRCCKCKISVFCRIEVNAWWRTGLVTNPLAPSSAFYFEFSKTPAHWGAFWEAEGVIDWPLVLATNVHNPHNKRATRTVRSPSGLANIVLKTPPDVKTKKYKLTN